MNHWIYLAKAAKGLTSGSQYAPALTACRAAHNAGDAAFVLSASHYMQMTKIKNPAQRRDLAAASDPAIGPRHAHGSGLDHPQDRTAQKPVTPLVLERHLRH
ncbi:hypothetical protein ACFPM7_15710 [Actinokineospora guangxiensis]|uniref:Uncharacterized protein n=1 Tax=Actinokineospora guangxiensis TaxID=1490288 RepID=A0ABW0EMD6_9PSEU